MDQKTPFGNIDTLLNKLNLPHQSDPTALQNLPIDLSKIVSGNDGLFGKATEAYCVTQHPELYTYAAIGGAVASATLLLGTIGLTFLIGKMVKTLRGRS